MAPARTPAQTWAGNGTCAALLRAQVELEPGVARDALDLLRDAADDALQDAATVGVASY